MHIDRYGAGSADLALKAFERALSLDPSNASAHAGAAWAYVSLGQNGAIGNAQARAQAMAEVRRALELDEGLAEAHTILGHLYFIYEWDWAAADRAFRHSLDLNPNSAVTRTYYADYLEAMGRFDDALVQAEMAKRLEPESGVAARRYALALYYKRDFAAAEQALREAPVDGSECVGSHPRGPSRRSLRTSGRRAGRDDQGRPVVGRRGRAAARRRDQAAGSDRPTRTGKRGAAAAYNAKRTAARFD